MNIFTSYIVTLCDYKDVTLLPNVLRFIPTGDKI